MIVSPYALACVAAQGYIPMCPPVLVRDGALYGTGGSVAVPAVLWEFRRSYPGSTCRFGEAELARGCVPNDWARSAGARNRRRSCGGASR